jgi:glycosyltransferase involved in cell wall biosynthesis
MLRTPFQFDDRIFEIAPNLSRADVAILVASLADGDRARTAYEYWREHTTWEEIPVQWQRLLPLLHRNLTRAGVKDHFLERIKGVRRFMWARNLRLIALAKRVHHAFSEAQIPGLFLKGASLVASRYVDRSIRPMDDIDILVPPDRVADAIHLLAELGFEPKLIRPASLLNRVLPDRDLSGWAFVNSAGDEVDIHWNAMHLDRRDGSDREAWLRARTAEFEGASIRVLDPAHQVLHICAHGVRDPDQGAIRWIADAVLVIRCANDIDWELIVERARVHRLSAVMARALDLLGVLVELPVGQSTIVKLHKQATWPERIEVRAWNDNPKQWQQGLLGTFLAVQHLKRGRADLFDAVFLSAFRYWLRATAGTKGAISAICRLMYLKLGQPDGLKRILASDRRLALAAVDQIPTVADIDLTLADGNETMFANGWSLAERSGRWTDGHTATLALRLERPTRQLPILKFEFMPATLEAHPVIHSKIFVNDRRVLVRRFEWNSLDQPEIVFAPPTPATPVSMMLVTFEIENPYRQGRESSEARSLGLMLTKMTVLTASSHSKRIVSQPQDGTRGSADKEDAGISGQAQPAAPPGSASESHEVKSASPLLSRIESLERKLADVEQELAHALGMLHSINKRTFAGWISDKFKPKLFRFAHYPPRPISVPSEYSSVELPDHPPHFAIVTPSFNQGRFLSATIESVLSQNYPALSYHVQDGGSVDDTRAVLESHGESISWQSIEDRGQSHAINLGFSAVSGDIMAYLNSDDILLPGALAYVAKYFEDNPDIDVVYSHRVLMNAAGLEIGRAILPWHDTRAIKWFDFVPQETMFWRRRVWTAVGGVDESFQYAMDWDFILRAQEAGFRFARLPRFLGCFRIHDTQKTSVMFQRGQQESERLRRRYLGSNPKGKEVERAIAGYLRRHVLLHRLYKLRVVRY